MAFYHAGMPVSDADQWFGFKMPHRAVTYRQCHNATNGSGGMPLFFGCLVLSNPTGSLFCLDNSCNEIFDVPAALPLTFS